jgi:transposase
MFAPYDPHQLLLLPPALQDWLPEGHLVHFVSDAVDQLDLEEFERAYRAEGSGNVAYHPRLMLKLLVYGYATGVFSSRRIATHIEENIAFRVLAAGQSPSHRTIARFRQEHIERFGAVFLQVVQLAGGAGLTALGTVAIDGTKVKANASKHKAMSYGRMKEEETRLKAEIATIIKAAEESDALEDGQFGPDFRGDELPAELKRREDRLAKIRAAKARLEERKQAEAEVRGDDAAAQDSKPAPSDQINFTDEESRIMKTSSGGFDQCYNAQTSVDGESLLIVAAEVTQSATDAKQLIPLVDATIKNVGREPGLVLADAGYRSEATFKALEDRGVKALVATGREGKRGAGKVSADKPATKRMRSRMKSKRGRRRYSMRKHIVEPVFGWVKQALGFRRFSMRGLAAVSGEWKLVCAAVNLRRLSKQIMFE